MKKTSLKDGLRVVTIPQKGTETASIIVMIGVGGRYETKKIAGISHFLEHMVFKGTAKRPTSHDIAAAIDAIGGTFNAFTGEEYTGFWAKVPANHLEVGLDVVADITQHAKLKPSDIEKERGVIIEEINMYEDSPRENIHNIFEETIFPGTALGANVIGHKESIRSISKKDFDDYIGRFYGADNIVVAVAGNIDEEKVIKLCDEKFNFQVKKADKKFEKITEGQTKPQIKIVNKKTEQTHLIYGVRGYDNNHPDKYISKLIAVILAGSLSSRLWREIREKRGLAYYVKGYSHSYRDAGYLMIQAGIDHGKLQDVVKIISTELVKLRDKGLQAGELERAKEFFKGNMVIDLEDSINLAEFYVAKELMGDNISSEEKVIAEIDKVTAEDIQRVAKDLFKNNNLNLAVIGKVKDQEAVKKLVKLD